MPTLAPASSKACIKLPRPLPKRKMREVVLQILYALSIDSTLEEAVLVPLVMSETAITQKHVLLALNISKEILAKAPEFDTLISQTIKTTSFSKLALIEKNVLRLTLFEHFYNDQPINSAILITEATRLIKKFSYIEACSLIYAVLNDIFRLSLPTIENPERLICG
ncbi:N utilization substance protein B [Chlamydia gallinacea 08-1274/3]|uniref:N utilization substance protein B n=1 Tax=Chlamydia gallinacea 08-1274/3 TaxID=1143323 RepID=A0A173DY69_9CHLA|nr:transcription antitermination factor NusB [Chlamydia gallinacea]ANG65851.1 N utilization substance protein B [Chlamydia gallinacea 08-1274/3]